MHFSDGTTETDTEFAARQRKLGQREVFSAVGRGMGTALAVAWVGGFVLMLVLVVFFFLSGPPV
jgi:hypothetical protein